MRCATLLLLPALALGAAIDLEKRAEPVSTDLETRTDQLAQLETRANGHCLPSDSDGMCKNRFSWNRWQLNFFPNTGGNWDWHGRDPINPGIYIHPDGSVSRGKQWAMPTFVTIEWKNGDIKTWWVPDMEHSCTLYGVETGGIKDAWACA